MKDHLTLVCLILAPKVPTTLKIPFEIAVKVVDLARDAFGLSHRAQQTFHTAGLEHVEQLSIIEKSTN